MSVEVVWGALTVQGAADGVGLGEVVDAGEELAAVALAVLPHGVDLGHGGRGVRPEDGLAVLAARGVAPGEAAAIRADCRGHQTVKHRQDDLRIRETAL